MVCALFLPAPITMGAVRRRQTWPLSTTLRQQMPQEAMLKGPLSCAANHPAGRSRLLSCARPRGWNTPVAAKTPTAPGKYKTENILLRHFVPAGIHQIRILR